jgi:hypothetical protein
MISTACLATGALTHNTLVVAAGVAAVGFAAGIVGSLSLLRKRPLIGDAAAHSTLVGVISPRCWPGPSLRPSPAWPRSCSCGGSPAPATTQPLRS